MLHIVNGGNVAHYASELEQAYRLRHRVFVEEKGWQRLRSKDGLERDGFDDAYAIHLMIVEAGVVVGYSRLLPTSRPHLLSDVYPYLAQRSIPRGGDVFEWTRYCVAPRKRGDGAVGNTGSQLLYCVLDYAMSQGVAALTMQSDPLWITRFLDFGFHVEPLGLPQQLDGDLTVALCVHLSKEALEICRRRLRVKRLRTESRGTPWPAIAKNAAA